MIYQLFTYLETEFPTETFKINVKYEELASNSLPDRLVLLRETGGPETAWFKYIQHSLQVLVRDVDAVKARKLSYDIYNKLDNKFGLILPSVTVDSVAHSQLQVAQISADARPSSLGDDENGRVQFSTNYNFIYSEN